MRFNRFIFLCFFLTIFCTDVMAISFAEQAKKAMDMYLKRKTRLFINQLYHIEREISGGRNVSINQKIDIGEDRESLIISVILSLMRFRHDHNNKMDRWAKRITTTPSESRFRFFRQFKMDLEIIKQSRGNISFPYVTVHWYPFAVWAHLEKHEVALALGLDEQSWRNEDNLLQKYAFFSFCRKLSSPDRYIQNVYTAFLNYQNIISSTSRDMVITFLKVHTGFSTAPPLWSRYFENVILKRWKYDYYMYQYVKIDKLPKIQEPLINMIIRTSIYARRQPQDIEFDQFYHRKVKLFKELVNEILIMKQRNGDLKLYWALYSFICRTFPYISAFRLTRDQSGKWSFINGYRDDRPAQGRFGNSIMGTANKLWHRLGAGGRLAERIFSPIFLLQQKDLNPEAIEFNKQFVDVKMGFKGFYDYFKRITNNSPQ